MSFPRTGALLDTLRLASGLTLFAFALFHFLNHALGLWSLDAMAAFQHARLAVTRSLPGSLALGAALALHLGLALWRLARLRTWRLPAATLGPLLSGMAIAVLLIPHLFESGIAPRAAGGVMSYPAALGLLWPGSALVQSLLLLLVWIHGCIGLHQWLKGEAWWLRRSHALAALAALIPAAALAGFLVAGREVERLKATQNFAPPFPVAELPEIKARGAAGQGVALALMGLALGLAGAGAGWAARRRRLAIVYEPGPKVLAAPGSTLLEISRSHRVPHLSVCGGKARCSTCRVRVIEGAEGLEAPTDSESALLRRIGAGPDVRLACQIRPTQPLTVQRLLNPGTAAPALREGLEAAGVMRVEAVLFVDIRGFTRLSEAKLAFDVVYILNAFFSEAGRAVEAAGGRVDNYMGDGMMALFEHADGLGPATRNALAAVTAIHGALARVNRRLAGEIDAPLAVAMGLHGGPLVSGRIGYGEAGRPTVIGRVVNIASRLESLAKARGVEVALSLACLEAAGLDATALTIEEADLRGLAEAFPVALARSAADLVRRRETAAPS
jgi:adenylate cyclase